MQVLTIHCPQVTLRCVPIADARNPVNNVKNGDPCRWITNPNTRYYSAWVNCSVHVSGEPPRDERKWRKKKALTKKAQPN